MAPGCKAHITRNRQIGLYRFSALYCSASLRWELSTHCSPFVGGRLTLFSLYLASTRNESSYPLELRCSSLIPQSRPRGRKRPAGFSGDQNHNHTYCKKNAGLAFVTPPNRQAHSKRGPSRYTKDVLLEMLDPLRGYPGESRLILPLSAEEVDAAIGRMFLSSGGFARFARAPGGWKHPSNGFLLLGSSIADDVAHDTKKGSIARAQEGINSKGNIIDI